MIMHKIDIVLNEGCRILNRAYTKFDNRSIEVLIDEEIEKNLKNNKVTILYVCIKYDYGHKDWGLSFEHHNFHHTLLNMDYSLIYFDYVGIEQKYGTEKMSQMLRDTVYYYQPDVLFYSHCFDLVKHSVWREISDELPTRTIIWLSDDHWRYEETKAVWELFNLILTTDRKGYEKRKKEGFSNVLLSQWGCNHYLYKNLKMEKIYDVSFVGRSYGERKEFIRTLKKKGIDVRVFGQGWENGNRVSQADLIKIFNQSKISLNISFASKGDKIQIKGRDFEAPGCGSLLLTKDTEEIAEYFIPEKEILTYHDVSEVADKIKYYLQHNEERKRICQAGYERCLRDHTWHKRFEMIFHEIGLI